MVEKKVLINHENKTILTSFEDKYSLVKINNIIPFSVFNKTKLKNSQAKLSNDCINTCNNNNNNNKPKTTKSWWSRIL